MTILKGLLRGHRLTKPLLFRLLGTKAAALIVTALLGLTLTGCSHEPLADPPVSEPLNKVFKDNYDEVWRAIQLTVRKYPVRLNNIESGILETDYIKGDQLFSDPVAARFKPGMRYKIVVRAVRGMLNSGSAVKVVVTKQSELQPDFFTGYQPVPSDGLEENVILYRIGRYLELEKILNKAPDSKAPIFNNNN